MPIFQECMEVFDDALFDSVLLGDETWDRVLFAPRDHPTADQTNLDTRIFIPNSQRFSVAQIRCAFLVRDSLLPVSHPAYGVSWITFRIGDVEKLYWTGQCWTIPHPAALLCESIYHSDRGLTLAKRILDLGIFKDPITIEPGESFHAVLTTQRPFPGLTFYLFLQGSRKRAVQ